MIKKLSKKTICLTVAAIIMAVCITVLVGVFILGPQCKAIRSVDSSIKEIEQKLIGSKTNDQSENVSALNQELSSAKKNLSRYVISPEQASDLTVDIGKIAKQAGVQGLHSTNRMRGSYGSINECLHIREGRMQIKFKSSFSQFAKFINLLELNEPVIFIDKFNIKRSTKHDGIHPVDMVLTFFVGQGGLTDIMTVGNFLNDPVLATGTGPAVN